MLPPSLLARADRFRAILSAIVDLARAGSGEPLALALDEAQRLLQEAEAEGPSPHLVVMHTDLKRVIAQLEREQRRVADDLGQVQRESAGPGYHRLPPAPGSVDWRA